MRPATQALVDGLRRAAGSGEEPLARGPTVSIIVVTRNGLHHLERLVDGLAHRTDYEPFEVVVVDNASTDGTVEWLRAVEGLPVRVVTNDRNESFSDANNRGLELATGELTLFLNNDVDPIEPAWLSRLVRPLATDGSVSATGALLVYPETPEAAATGGAFRELTVQHAGVGFELRSGRVRARNLEVGRSPLAPGMAATREVAALTAACLLARTATLRDLGGFDPAYFYGSEDWDLSLRLGEVGRLLLVGSAALFHHEYGTQSVFSEEERAAYRRRNHTVFNARWGADLRRRLLLEHLGDDGTLTGGLPSTFVATSGGGTVDAVAEGLRGIGWREHDGDGSSAPVLAVVEAGEEPSGDCAVLAEVATSRRLPRGIHVVDPGRDDDGAGDPIRLARTVITGLRATVQRPRFAIRTCAPDPQEATRWGDTYFAESLADALRRAGFEARQFTVAEWDEPWAQPYDVVIHLRGIHEHRPRPRTYDVTWVISHPQRVTDAELDGTDLVLVASSACAERFRARTDTPVAVLHQATDAHRFVPPRNGIGRTAAGVVVVANQRWPYRRAPRWLDELGIDFELYGANWEGLPEERHRRSGFVANDELAGIYASADIVVADQWDHMARDGFVANRLFDVAAAGGFVISDHGPGVEEVFGDLVPTYRTRHELGELVRHYLADEVSRQTKAAAAMRLVREHHTFDARVATLLELLEIDRA